MNDAEKIYAAKEFIDSKLPQHFSIYQVSIKMGINEQKLKQGFKEIFGTGLYGYLRDKILNNAKTQLEQTRMSIKQIALHAGYKKSNNFSAAFKKKFGATPLEWRKQFNDNKSSLP